jgi:N-methylhydantoinase A
MPLSVDAARTAFTLVAARLGCTIERTAHGVLGLVVSNMVRAIRAVTVERGHDPRQCALMAFGGAGPLHASDVARSLGMREIIVPRAPGILCAQGLVVSDLQEDFVRTARTRVDAAHLDHIQGHINALIQAAEAWCYSEGLAPARRSLEVTLDMRYIGQNFELSVPLDGALLAGLQEPGGLARLRMRFFTTHETHYGYHSPDDPVEIMNYRITARGRLYRSPEAPGAAALAIGAPVPGGTRRVYFTADTAVATPVFDRTALAPGHTLVGPAVIEQLDATTLVYPGDTLRVDNALNLLIEVAT